MGKFDEVKQKLRRESFHRMEPLRDDTDGVGSVQQSYQQKAATMDETRSSSLAEKLGQLIVGSNSPRQQRSRYDDDISSSQQLSPRPSTNPYMHSSQQYNTAKQPLQYSGRDSIQQKKMPSDWRLQLLQHIERKRIEKGGSADGPTSPNRDRLHAGLNRNHSSTANDVWKLQKSPEIPPKSERHRSVTAPTSLPVESLYINFDSVRVQEPSGIVSSGGSRLSGRRSSGRYLRARTPGPELGSNLTSTPTDPIHRPK